MPKWLDRLWLIAIGASFVLLTPIWLILSGERFGWRFTIGGIVVALMLRYRAALAARLG